MPTGRPPATRSVYSFEEPLLTPPDELVVDTSFVFQALHSLEPYHAACQAFMTRLSEAGATVCFNRLVEVELAEASFKVAVRERHGSKAWPTKKPVDKRISNRAGRLTDRFMESWQALLATVDHLIVEPGEVIDPGGDGKCGLRSMDAVHVATCGYLGVPAIATPRPTSTSLSSDARLAVYVSKRQVGPARARRGGKAKT